MQGVQDEAWRRTVELDRKAKMRTAVFFCILLGCAAAVAQTAEKMREAAASDVSSTDAILKAAYDVISGPAGKQRDWDRLRSLCVPDVRFVVTAKKGSPEPVHSYGFDAFAEASQKFLETEGFHERGIANRTERFDRMAHVLSTYESRHSANDPKPFERGINSFQLVNDGKRWWIVTIFWEQESQENPIPKKYTK
jgi:hypothetical protein